MTGGVMMAGVGAAEARIASIRARFAVSDRWVHDPEIEAPYLTGGLYVGSSVADVAAPGDAVARGAVADVDDAFAPNATAPGDTVGVVLADLADPSTAATQQRLLGSTYGVQTSSLRPDDGAWIRRLPEAGLPWAGAVADAARANGLEPELLAAVAWTESGFDASAQADDGALGLLQLTPAVAERVGVDATLPLDNLSGGARELRRLLDAADGRVQEAVASYHAGETVGLGRRDGWSTATTAYVDTVMERRSSVLGQTRESAPSLLTPSLSTPSLSTPSSSTPPALPTTADPATTPARWTAAGWMAR